MMPDLDPLDRALQAHAPTLMVPRHSALPLIDRPGHRYLAAADGLWLELLRPWLHLRQKIADAELALPYGALFPFIQYAFTADDLARVQALFTAEARERLPNEHAAWAVWDERAGRLDYRPLLAIHASSASIEFHRPRLEDHEHLAIDLHSHGAGEAFFSATDDADDAGEVKLAVCAGTLDGEPTFDTRLCALGLFLGAD